MNNFGNKLSELRKQNKMTQRELGNILNVSDRTISKWEVGVSLPNIDDLYNISNYFNIPIYNLTADSKLNKNIIISKDKKLFLLKLIGVIISFFNLIIRIIELLFK